MDDSNKVKDIVNDALSKRDARIKDLEQKLTEKDSQIIFLKKENVELQESIEVREEKAIIQVNGNGSIVRANPLVEKMLGYDENELAGNSIQKIGASDQDVSFLGLVPTMGHESYQYEGARRAVNIKLKNGDKRKLGITIDILYDDRKKYSGAFIQLEEMWFFRRWFSNGKTDVYKDKAPEVLNEEYRQSDLKNLMLWSLGGTVTEAYIDLEKTKEIEEMVAKNFADISKRETPEVFYLLNASPEIREYLVSYGVPEENLPLKEEGKKVELNPSEQDNS